jgi:hypothetical protein
MNSDRFIENYWKGSALRYWKRIFWKMKNKEIDTWDYQWTFTMWYYKGLAILPNANMITNIGFGQDATHTVHEDSRFVNMKRCDLILTKHPAKIERDVDADEYTYKHYISPSPIILRIYRKIKRIIYKVRQKQRKFLVL